MCQLLVEHECQRWVQRQGRPAGAVVTNVGETSGCHGDHMAGMACVRGTVESVPSFHCVGSGDQMQERGAFTHEPSLWPALFVSVVELL